MTTIRSRSSTTFEELTDLLISEESMIKMLNADNQVSVFAANVGPKGYNHTMVTQTSIQIMVVTYPDLDLLLLHNIIRFLNINLDPELIHHNIISQDLLMFHQPHH